jgi:hypothetical protein
MSHQPRPGNPDDVMAQRAKALAQAALAAARQLGLSPGDTATVMGIPQNSLKSLQQGSRLLDGTSGEAERADALVRIVRRLKALLGDQETLWRSWIRQPCETLGDKPLTILLQRQGPEKVARFVERTASLTAK